MRVHWKKPHGKTGLSRVQIQWAVHLYSHVLYGLDRKDRNYNVVAIGGYPNFTVERWHAPETQYPCDTVPSVFTAWRHCLPLLSLLLSSLKFTLKEEWASERASRSSWGRSRSSSLLVRGLNFTVNVCEQFPVQWGSGTQCAEQNFFIFYLN